MDWGIHPHVALSVVKEQLTILTLPLDRYLNHVELFLVHGVLEDRHQSNFVFLWHDRWSEVSLASLVDFQHQLVDILVSELDSTDNTLVGDADEESASLAVQEGTHVFKNDWDVVF